MSSTRESNIYNLVKRYILFHGKRHPKDMGAAQRGVVYKAAEI